MTNVECEFSTLPVDQCGCVHCRPDLNKPEEDEIDILLNNIKDKL